MSEWKLVRRDHLTNFTKHGYILLYLGFYAGERWRLYIGESYIENLIAAMDAPQSAEKIAQLWADQIIAAREEKKMSEPWSKEQLERIKAVHDRETCETTKKVLRELAPEAFARPQQIETFKAYRSDFNESIILTFPTNCTKEGINGYVLQHGGTVMWPENIRPDNCHLLRNVRIILMVDGDGNFTTAKVKED